MNNEIDESPYCEVCGTCGCIGCCGIRNFISEHIEGKTNCKNESWIIQDLINLCDYKDEVFKQNEKYKEVLDKIKEYIKEEEYQEEGYGTLVIETKKIKRIIGGNKILKEQQQELERYKNIIDELERYFIDMFNRTQDTKYLDDLQKIKELKGSDS